MKLIEVVKKLGDIDSALTIYTKKPWNVNSNCEVALVPDDGSYPQDIKINDLEYFIEIFIAKEFIDGWARNLGRTPTTEEKAVRLISYAENDA